MILHGVVSREHVQGAAVPVGLSQYLLAPLLVQSAVYKEYAAAYGWLSLLFITVLWGSEQSVRILTNWWLSQWTSNQIRYEFLSRRGQ